MSYRYSKQKIQGFVDNIWYKEVTLNSAKSSGPGGQNVNKTESKIQLSWLVKDSAFMPEQFRDKLISQQLTNINEDGFLRIDAQVHRTQKQNKELIQKKLQKIIFEAFKPPKPIRKITEAPKHVVDKRIAEKKRRSKTRASRNIKNHI